MDITKISNDFTIGQIRTILNDKTLFNSKNEFSLKDAQCEYNKLTQMPADTVDSKLKEALLKLTTCGNYEAFSGGTDKNISKHELGHAIRTLRFEKLDDQDTDDNGHNPSYNGYGYSKDRDYDSPCYPSQSRFCYPDFQIFWQSMLQFMRRCNPQYQYLSA
jgi:hypothetical protein